MKKFRLLFIPVLLSILVFYGCSEGQPAINEAEVLVKYLESADSPLGKDYVNSDMPSIISATDVYSLNQTDDIYIIDIRSGEAYNAGHIENAVNVAAADILTHIESVDLSQYQKVAVVCFSGQTAAWATSLLRLAGYDKAYSMKWGMCSWSSDTQASWESNRGNARATGITTVAAAKPEAGSLPSISTGKTTGEEIFRARLSTVLAEGFDAAKVSNSAVWDNLDDYFIINYWSEAHYSNTGHIPGAMQYTPKASIKLDADLKTIDGDKKVAVYCYTGQTSAFLTAYLRILGYDAKSILFGTNGMFYDKCADAGMTVWTENEVKGYPLVTE